MRKGECNGNFVVELWYLSGKGKRVTKYLIVHFLRCIIHILYVQPSASWLILSCTEFLECCNTCDKVDYIETKTLNFSDPFTIVICMPIRVTYCMPTKKKSQLFSRFSTAHFLVRKQWQTNSIGIWTWVRKCY